MSTKTAQRPPAPVHNSRGRGPKHPHALLACNCIFLHNLQQPQMLLLSRRAECQMRHMAQMAQSVSALLPHKCLCILHSDSGITHGALVFVCATGPLLIICAQLLASTR